MKADYVIHANKMVAIYYNFDCLNIIPDYHHTCLGEEKGIKNQKDRKRKDLVGVGYVALTLNNSSRMTKDSKRSRSAKSSIQHSPDK